MGSQEKLGSAGDSLGYRNLRERARTARTSNYSGERCDRLEKEVEAN